ncbi:single-stranded DNA-binding protein [Mucilaginibacter sp. HD30]
MSGVNKVILAGHIADVPSYQSLENGTKVLTFQLLTTEIHNKSKSDVEHQERHNIVVMASIAEKVKYPLEKGLFAYIEGSIKTRTFVDLHGVKQHVVDIRASSISKMG